MQKRIVLIGTCLIVVTALATTIFWHGLSSVDFGVPKHLVQIRYQGIINSVKQMSIVFLQNNKTSASYIINGDGKWYNLTLHNGVYIVKVYNADSGLYLKSYEINVAKGFC